MTAAPESPPAPADPAPAGLDPLADDAPLAAAGRSGALLGGSLVALLCASLLAALAVGAQPIPLAEVLELLASLLGWRPAPGAAAPPASHATIVLELRLPRVALMALVGSALATAGATYQGLFRNPLADPYIVGVASGAGLGATLVIALLEPGSGSGLALVPLGAFAGGIVTVVLVLLVARVGSTLPVTTTLLAGIAVGSFASALTSFWMLHSPTGLRRAFHWLLGGYSGGGWTPVAIVAAYLALSLVVLVPLARLLNVLQLEEEEARQLGVRVERIKLLLVAVATLLTAAAVAFGGLLGFVGLVVPHLARLLGGPDHRRLIPLSALGGASLLVLADLAARTLLAPRELPVGVITALVGAPFFILVLRRVKRSVF